VTDGIRRIAGAVESGDPPAATAAFRQARRHRLAVSATTSAFRMNSGSQKIADAVEKPWRLRGKFMDNANVDVPAVRCNHLPPVTMT